MELSRYSDDKMLCGWRSACRRRVGEQGHAQIRRFGSDEGIKGYKDYEEPLITAFLGCRDGPSARARAFKSIWTFDTM